MATQTMTQEAKPQEVRAQTLKTPGLDTQVLDTQALIVQEFKNRGERTQETSKPVETINQYETVNQDEGSRDMATFLELLRMLADNASTAWIDQVLKDNDTLRESVKTAENERDSFARYMAKLQSDLDAAESRSAQSKEAGAKTDELIAELEGVKKTIANNDRQLRSGAAKITELQGKIDALTRELNGCDDKIRKHEERHADDGTRIRELEDRHANDCARIRELEGSLRIVKTELDSKSTQLQELHGMSSAVTDEPKEFVSKEIDKIYSFARLVANKYFGEDLPSEILADLPLIEEVAKLVKPVPFPASNSQAAKKARVAAFLACVGSRLADQIFLPFYPVQDDEQYQDGIDTISVMLSDLSVTDPKRELHLRSVLLGISPEDQLNVAYSRAQNIANEIFGTLGIVLSTEQQTKFLTDIKKLCRLAVDTWDRLRSLKAKIEPFTETSEESDKYWLPAELEAVGPQVKKIPVLNGGKMVTGLVSKPSMHSLKSGSKVVLVWPGFSYGADVLKQGFMLLDSQVRLADEETRPLKRTQRAMQRASTNSSLQSHRMSTIRKPKMFPRGAGD